ncbi:hypothetical protein [Streptomyces acidiscabies]|uniref:hypothetical protein n=1 Tax=Streptomyces acidiscabies TaxID=42234 RepID=UPI0038F5F4FD
MTLAEFKRRAGRCPAFQCINYRHPHLSGPCVVWSVGSKVIRYTPEGALGIGRTEWPSKRLSRVEDNKITWLDPDDGTDSFAFVFPFTTDAGPRYVEPAEAEALLIGATGVGEHRSDGATVVHRYGCAYPVTWGGVPQATLPGEPAEPRALATVPVTYHVDLSLSGTTWHRAATPDTACALMTSASDAQRDGARLTREGWTFHLAYPSGLCARLTPTGLDGQLVDQALHVAIQEPGWDDPGTAMELAQRVLRTVGLR